MACVDLGKLRAYCDGELAPGEVDKLESHIAGCAQCKAQLDDVRQVGVFAAAKLSSLAPRETESPSSTEVALAAVRRELNTEEGATGWFGRLARGLRPQWQVMFAALAVAAIAIAIAALPPVRSVADDLLGVFRVQKFTPVTVDPSTIASVPMLDPMKMGTFEGIAQQPEVTTGLSPAEAAAKVNFAVRLPGQLPASVGDQPRLSVVGAFDFAYTFDRAKAEAYLESLGLKGIPLPSTLNGKRVSASVPTHLVAQYSADGTTKASLIIVEGRSPSLEIPDSVDTEEVRNAILSFPGLPPELVVQLRALDWKTTAPVPVIKGDTSSTVAVDGVEGLSVHDSVHNMTVILWQKQDVIYALGGQVSEAELIAAANSMR